MGRPSPHRPLPRGPAASSAPGPPAHPGRPDFRGAVRAPLPRGVKPMLATLVDRPFDRRGWAFEVKWDGYRTLAEIRNGRVRLYSRRGNDQNERFPTVAEALRGSSRDALFDGEIVALNSRGRPDFQKLQNARGPSEAPIVYYVFDVLYAAGHDLRGLPLRRRRAILERVLPVSPSVRLSEAVERAGRAFFRAAERSGLEGVLAKNLSSPYLPGVRSLDWLKIKTRKRQEAVIAGFTAPRGSRQFFGSLVLGVYTDGEMVYIGRVGTGFGQGRLEDVYGKMRTLVTDRCPFPRRPRIGLPVTWVEPRLVGEVEFAEWTAEGRMRQPVFVGLRDDKEARDVRRERARPASGTVEKRGPDVETRASLTHLDKVFWPEAGFTKGDLVEYYARMARWILPYLKDRPETLNRHPDGIAGKSFFQKDVTRTPPPPWVETVKIASGGRELEYLVCQDRDTLLYLANLGCIEINVWNSTFRQPDSPDYAVLDFDPVGTPFASVVEAVLAARTSLDEFGLPAFCKTSGGKGMHVYVPLLPRFSHEQARELAHLVCLLVHRRHPRLTSLRRNPDERKGRVYLDYLQNRREATMAAPYALRPREGAPISTPLAWKEVGPGLDPLDFNIRTVPERLADRGDPWADLFEKRLDLNEALARFEKWRRRRASSL